MTTKAPLIIEDTEFYILNNVGSGLTRVQIPGDTIDLYVYDASLKSWRYQPPTASERRRSRRVCSNP